MRDAAQAQNSRRLKRGSTAAFACGIVGIPVTAIAVFVWLLGAGDVHNGSGSDMLNSDDPATQHVHFVTAMEIGGVTIALLTLAVLLDIVQMRRSGLPLRSIRAHLGVAAVTGVAAVVLESFPATFHWCVIPGIVCGASLIACHQRLARVTSKV